MKLSFKAVFAFAALAAGMLGCQIPFSQANPDAAPALPPTPAALQAAAKPAPELPTATAALPPTPAQAEPARLAVTPTGWVVDFSQARIKLSDLPAGFQELNPASQEKIGLTEDSLASIYDGVFTQAEPGNFFAYINARPEAYEVALGLLYSPLTAAEKAAFDAELLNKELAVQLFTENLNENAQLIAGSDQIGEKSIGFTFLSQAEAVSLRGDLFIARRDSAVLLVMVLFQEGKEPPIRAALLAALWDAQLKLVLNR